MGCLLSNEEVLKDINKKKKSIITDYLLIKTLGKGASCRVVQGLDKREDEKIAIKIMTKEKSICKTLYNHEVNMLRQIKHSNIIKLINNQEDDSNFYIMTKLYEGGELFDRIVSNKYKITEKLASKLVGKMLEAIKFLHERNIVHRDLKPENFVFDTKDENANIILIDFGCAKKVKDEEEYRDLVGTVYYLAPELAAQSAKISRNGKVLKMADIWSIGVIAYVMLTGRPPFKGRNNKDIFTNIIKNDLKFPSDVPLSESFKDFVKKNIS